jgi:hypothetical protein
MEWSLMVSDVAVSPSPVAAAPASTFGLFSKLPLDIRIIIMLLALPEGREVDLCGGRQFSQPKAPAVRPRRTRDIGLFWHLQSIPLPSALYVNREFRAHALELYTILYQEAIVEPTKLCDPGFAMAPASQLPTPPRSLTCFSDKRDRFVMGTFEHQWSPCYALTSLHMYRSIRFSGNEDVFSCITSITINAFHLSMSPQLKEVDATTERDPCEYGFSQQGHYKEWRSQMDEEMRRNLPLIYLRNVKKFIIVDCASVHDVATNDRAMEAAGNPELFGTGLIPRAVNQLLMSRLVVTRVFKDLMRDIPSITLVFKFPAVCDPHRHHTNVYRSGSTLDHFRHEKTWAGIPAADWHADPTLIDDRIVAQVHDPSIAGPLFSCLPFLFDHGEQEDYSFWEESKADEYPRQ